MHELSVTISILKICQEEKRIRGFKRVNEIRIKEGELTGLVPNCINYYFKIIAKGTECEGAKIIIDKVPLKIKCMECLFTGEVNKNTYMGPKCNSNKIKILNGKEFYIDSMEVD